MKSKLMKGLAIVSLVMLMTNVVQAKIEYLSLTARGNEMAPAICDGDIVKVRICVNASFIKSGSPTDPNSGDMIVYCAGAVYPQPASMFTVGRVIDKYRSGGQWRFKTKMDSQDESDARDIPEYALVGVVEEVTRSVGSQSSPSLSDADSQNQPQRYNADPIFQLIDVTTATIDLAVGIVSGILLGLIVRKARSICQ